MRQVVKWIPPEVEKEWDHGGSARVNITMCRSSGM